MLSRLISGFSETKRLRVESARRCLLFVLAFSFLGGQILALDHGIRHGSGLNEAGHVHAEVLHDATQKIDYELDYAHKQGTPQCQAYDAQLSASSLYFCQPTLAAKPSAEPAFLAFTAHTQPAPTWLAPPARAPPSA